MYWFYSSTKLIQNTGKISIFQKAKTMIIERTNTKILIRIPNTIDIDGIQRAINYIRYKELTADSIAKQEDVDQLADEINKNWWEKNKDRLLY